MHSSLTFHSYMKPVTSSQIHKIYNEVHNFSFFFHQSGCQPVHFSPCPPKKSRINVLIKLISIIRVDKQSLNRKHKFWGFILILKVPWDWLRTKWPCHTISFHQCGTFLSAFVATVMWSDGFILTTWTLSSCEIVKLMLIKYIPQHLSESWNS